MTNSVNWQVGVVLFEGWEIVLPVQTDQLKGLFSKKASAKYTHLQLAKKVIAKLQYVLYDTTIFGCRNSVVPFFWGVSSLLLLSMCTLLDLDI